MHLNRELLDKFVDGELSPQDSKRVAEQLAQQPEWNAYVQQQDALRQLLRARFAELGQAVPERLVKTALEAPVSRWWFLRRALGFHPALRLAAAAGLALAVGLVVGLGLRPQADFVPGPSGQLLARGGLGRALDNRLAAENPAGTATRLGISFRNRSGRDCRTFSSGESAGIACHANGDWVIETIVRHQAENARAQYRMAGSEMPEAVRRAIMSAIVGEPFDAAAEQRARARGWPGR
jgi:hypothetical protein